MNTLHDLGLLTMADVAELLHCSKAHVCKAVSGRVRWLSADTGSFARSPKAGAQGNPLDVD